ncbi:hypothetical protein HS141_10170 [Cetobacterium somerae]|uniref:hypothetical protein n=1 Tax=Cetobacterium somerae TaxID=188913 RepID=UPI00211EB706|nr:hypothetical protein [Cetobacterium somerae]MCQ9627299.1 hypothetical protein [Cetobacterium somerae]
MKKLILGLLLATSVVSFASKKEKMIEKELMTKYPALTDGTTSIKVDEYDVDVDEKHIDLKIELKGTKDKEEFNKLNKEKLDALAAEMAKFTQTEAKHEVPVNLKIKLDLEKPLPDETLFKKTF